MLHQYIEVYWVNKCCKRP